MCVALLLGWDCFVHVLLLRCEQLYVCVLVSTQITVQQPKFMLQHTHTACISTVHYMFVLRMLKTDMVAVVNIGGLVFNTLWS